MPLLPLWSEQWKMHFTSMRRSNTITCDTERVLLLFRPVCVCVCACACVFFVWMLLPSSSCLCGAFSPCVSCAGLFWFPSLFSSCLPACLLFLLLFSLPFPSPRRKTKQEFIGKLKKKIRKSQVNK